MCMLNWLRSVPCPLLCVTALPFFLCGCASLLRFSSALPFSRRRRPQHDPGPQLLHHPLGLGGHHRSQRAGRHSLLQGWAQGTPAASPAPGLVPAALLLLLCPALSAVPAVPAFSSFLDPTLCFFSPFLSTVCRAWRAPCPRAGPWTEWQPSSTCPSSRCAPPGPAPSRIGQPGVALRSRTAPAFNHISDAVHSGPHTAPSLVLEP